jgi:hypothetical protein
MLVVILLLLTVLFIMRTNGVKEGFESYFFEGGSGVRTPTNKETSFDGIILDTGLAKGNDGVKHLHEYVNDSLCQDYGFPASRYCLTEWSRKPKEPQFVSEGINLSSELASAEGIRDERKIISHRSLPTSYPPREPIPITREIDMDDIWHTISINRQT